QRQPNARTVQGVLEEAIATMVHEPVLLRGAGRTDAGVHARAQVANFRTVARLPADGLRKGLNGTLPDDVAVLRVEEVDMEFDARRSARGKHYAYRVWNRPSRSPLRARTSWHLYRGLEVERMNRAARGLLGEHDFSAYRAADCDRKNPVRLLRRCE